MSIHEQLDYLIEPMGALCSLSSEARRERVQQTHERTDENMNREDVKKLLEWHGFDLDDVDIIWYKSDRVGDLSGALLTLSDYIPSVIDGDYRAVDKTIININSHDAVERLEHQVNILYDTQRRWEEHLRELRIQRMRKYFKNKRISAEYSQMEMIV
jgi:hypothetical protein